MLRSRWIHAALASVTICVLGAAPALAEGDLGRVKHIIILMQENHSFDNYFGALAYAPDSPYHSGPCKDNDHTCVDGLVCTRDVAGNVTCANTNLDDDGTLVAAFHEPNYCVKPDV